MTFMLPRAPLRVLAALIIAVTTSVAVFAHEGEDHSETAASAPAATAAVAPAAEAAGKRFELAAELDAARAHLTLWVDDWSSNAPVEAADVTVRMNGRAFPVPEVEPGVYVLDLEQPLGAAAIPVSVEVSSGGRTEVLAAVLSAAPAAAVEEHAHTDWRSFALGAAAALGVALLLWLGRRFWRRRHAGTAAAVLLLLLAMPVLAHEGENHGNEVAGGTGGAANRAVRLPDGAVSVPKPVQRVLGIRTVVAGAGTAPAVVRLAGQVVPDPSRNARLATAVGGRVLPVGGGFPLIGQAVAAGQPLFRVQATLAAVDAVTVASELRALDREIRLAQQEYDRVKFLRNVVAQARIDSARANLEGLKRQRIEAAAPVSRDELVRAPFAGRVTRVSIAVGEIAQPGQVAVELAGSGAGLVEARGTPDLAGRTLSRMVAVTSTGVRVPLALAGRSPGVTGGVETLQLRVPPGAPLRIGESVTVEAQIVGAANVPGVAVPASAVVTASDGQRQVFVKRSPLVYAPRLVRSETAPGGGMLLTAGVKPGERVVSVGAALLAQVR